MTNTLVRAGVAKGTAFASQPQAYKRPPRFLHTLMKLWYTKSMGDGLYQPIPQDKAQYRSDYAAAWNTLLVGNGPTHGWGVTTHGLSLTGQLGVALSRASGQPVDVDYVGDECMNAATTLDWLAETHFADYDMIVLVLSMNDALRLSDPNKWATDIFELLVKIRSEREPGTPLLIIGMQPVASVHGYANFLGSFAQKHADKLNAIMQVMAEQGGDTFMKLPAAQHEPDRPFGSPATYAAWANDISDVGAALLPKGEPVVRERRSKQWQWDGTEKTMGWDGVDRAEPLRKLVEEARAEFKIPIAYVSVMDESVQLMATTHGPLSTSVPRHLTYCDETAKQDETLIIPNGRKDARFKDNPYLDLTQMPFYVGKSLKDREGEVIGTFCLMAPFPRAKESVNTERFDEYARKAQDALWAIEDGD